MDAQAINTTRNNTKAFRNAALAALGWVVLTGPADGATNGQVVFARTLANGARLEIVCQSCSLRAPGEPPVRLEQQQVTN